MRAVRIAGIALGGIYAAYVAFVMLSAGRGSSRTTDVVPLLLFFSWALSPVVVLAGVAYRSEGRPGRAIELMRFVAVCALVLFGASVYQVTFFGNHPDAQSGLLFIFVPLYQWLAVAIVLVLLAAVTRYHRRRGT
jgi:hypothetical protein